MMLSDNKLLETTNGALHIVTPWKWDLEKKKSQVWL